MTDLGRLCLAVADGRNGVFAVWAQVFRACCGLQERAFAGVG
jgi:hypothetical protein